jgi:hypothetical protein
VANKKKVSDGAKIGTGITTQTVIPMYWTLTKSQKAEVDKQIKKFGKAIKEGREPSIDE